MVYNEENNFVIHKSIFLKGRLLDQHIVDFLSREKIDLFVARNLSKRPTISWKMKKQKRSLCIN